MASVIKANMKKKLPTANQYWKEQTRRRDAALEKESEDNLYESIYMDVVKLVEKDNIQGEFYLDTVKKLKAKYIIKLA